jgi:hypothetical protein
MSRRHPALRPRRPRRIPATITAAIVLVIGGLSAAIGIDRLGTGTPLTAATRGLNWLAGLSWSGPVMLAASSVAVVLGVVLVVCAIVPGKRKATGLPISVSADPAPADSEAAIPHRALGQLIAARAQSLNGIDRVRVDATEHRVRVRANTPTRYVQQVSDDLQHNVADTLSSMGIRRQPRIKVQVDHNS